MLALIVVSLYLAVLIGVGVVKSRRVDDSTGFILAGRNLGPVVLLGTLLATWTGTGSIFGNAEEAYRVGLPSLMLPFASVLGIFALIAMAPRVRQRGRVTLQDLLEERFGPMARVLGTLTLVTAYLVIVSYQLRAANAVLEGVFTSAGLGEGFAAGGAAVDDALRSAGLTVEHGGNSLSLLVVAGLIGLYTALAGLMSVAITDGFNGVLMLLGVAIALPLVWIAAAGGDAATGLEASGVIDRVVATLPESGRSVWGHYSTFDVVSRLLPPFLLVLGDANLHQRFLSARTPGAARLAAILLIPGVLLVDAVILLTAMAGRALMPELENPGHIMLSLALDTGILPAALGALLVASILAVIVSTADSYLLSCSASLVRDVYQRFFRREASERVLLFAARTIVIVLTAVAFLMALQSSEFFAVSLFAYTIYGVGITPVLVAALFWKRATTWGAVASMVVGPAVAVTWEAQGMSAVAANWMGLPEGTAVGAVVPAVLVSAVVLVAVSLVTRPRPTGGAEPEAA